MLKLNFKISFIVLALLLCVVVNIFRFMYLDKAPMGFHVDESASALSISCISKEGIGGRGVPMPIFDDLSFGTPKPAPYTFFGAFWTKIFGYSTASMRSISAIGCVFGIVGIFFLGRLLFGWQGGLLSAMCASISPWAWVFSRIAYESILGPVFIVWGIFFFLKKQTWWTQILAAFLFMCSMYCYPPMRMVVPVTIMILILFRFKFTEEKNNWKFLGLFFVVFIILNIPLLKGLSTWQLQYRFNQVGILNKDYLAQQGKTLSIPDVLPIFIKNYLLHFRPDFLFYKGSSNMMHSTGFPGQILSWLDSFALFCGILVLFMFIKKRSLHMKSRETFIVVLLLGEIALNIVPSALTWEGLPHALRIIGGWPFVMLLCGYCLDNLSRQWKWNTFVSVFIGAAFAFGFLNHYFKVYPKICAGMYAPWLKDWSEKAKTDSEWIKILAKYHWSDIHVRYYMMQYHGDTCMGSFEKWLKVSDFMKKQLSK